MRIFPPHSSPLFDSIAFSTSSSSLTHNFQNNVNLRMKHLLWVWLLHDEIQTQFSRKNYIDGWDKKSIEKREKIETKMKRTNYLQKL